MKFIFFFFFLFFSFSLFAKEPPTELLLHTVKKGETLSHIVPKHQWGFVVSYNHIAPKYLKEGMKIYIPKNPEEKVFFQPVPEKVSPKGKSLFFFTEEGYFGAYENGELQFWGPISSASGKKECKDRKGRLYKCRTPKGEFKILGKERWRVSRKYGNLPMNFAQRITWSGYFFHEGRIIGKKASHGCIRLLPKDARKLFFWTDFKTKVFVE